MTPHDLEEDLQDLLREPEADAELVRAIRMAIRTRPQQRRSSGGPLAIVGLAAALALAAGIATRQPSTGPGDDLRQSPAASASLVGSGDVDPPLLARILRRVDLTVGPVPGGPTLLDVSDTGVAVVGGPVWQGGVEWYRIEVPLRFGSPFRGWVPAVEGGEPTLELQPLACPATAPSTTATLGIMGPASRLWCFGGREYTLEVGIARRQPLETVARFAGEPAWLASDAEIQLYGPSGWNSNDLPIPVRVDPASGVEILLEAWDPGRRSFR